MYVFPCLPFRVASKHREMETCSSRLSKQFHESFFLSLFWDSITFQSLRSRNCVIVGSLQLVFLVIGEGINRSMTNVTNSPCIFAKLNKASPTPKFSAVTLYQVLKEPATGSKGKNIYLTMLNSFHCILTLAMSNENFPS
jgi:hypothetical protein